MFSKCEYIYAIYTEKSFTKAAKKLYISQPSLSAAVKNIEKKVGAPLFERNGSGVKLTEIGQEYICATEKIMHIESDFENKIHDIYNLESGKITVGGTNYLCSYALPQIINCFTSSYPKIEVTLVEANSENLLNLIANQDIDILVDSYDENMYIHEGSPLLNERILLCVPAHWEINKKFKENQIRPESIYDRSADLDSFSPVPVKEFENEPFIMLKKGNDMYNRAFSVFDKWEISPKIIFSVDQLNTSCALAESGMGACFVTDTLFKFSKRSDSVVLYNVSEEHSSRMLYIAYKKNRYCNSAMKKFIQTAKNVLSKRN